VRTNSAPQLEKFEQAVVFRFARVMPVGGAAFAFLLGILALGALAYSAIPVKAPDQLALPDDPDPVVLTRADVEAQMASPVPHAAPGHPTARPSEPAVDSAALAVASAVADVRAVVSQRGLSWTTQYRTVCEEQYYGYCIRQGRRVAAAGVGEPVENLLDYYNLWEGRTTVTPPGTQLQITVNSSNSEEKVAVLGELHLLLQEVPSADTRRFVQSWAALRLARESERSANFAADNRRVLQANDSALAAYQQRVTSMRDVRMSAISGLGASLSILMFVGLVLAILAVERNTRALKARSAPEPPAQLRVPALHPPATPEGSRS
jgi:hypothetical protein